MVNVAPHYKYLGLIFSSRLSSTPNKVNQANQGKKASFQLKTVIRKLGGISFSDAFKLFDSVVLPILYYGSEIWGFVYSQQIEQVQLQFCKFLLGTSTTANDAAVLGELGRLPLYVTYMKKCIKYWLQLLEMSPYRYLYNVI